MTFHEDRELWIKRANKLMGMIRGGRLGKGALQRLGLNEFNIGQSNLLPKVEEARRYAMSRLSKLPSGLPESPLLKTVQKGEATAAADLTKPPEFRGKGAFSGFDTDNDYLKANRKNVSRFKSEAGLTPAGPNSAQAFKDEFSKTKDLTMAPAPLRTPIRWWRSLFGNNTVFNNKLTDRGGGSWGMTPANQAGPAKAHYNTALNRVVTPDPRIATSAAQNKYLSGVRAHEEGHRTTFLSDNPQQYAMVNKALPGLKPSELLERDVITEGSGHFAATRDVENSLGSRMARILPIRKLQEVEPELAAQWQKQLQGRFPNNPNIVDRLLATRAHLYTNYLYT